MLMVINISAIRRQERGKFIDIFTNVSILKLKGNTYNYYGAYSCNWSHVCSL